MHQKLLLDKISSVLAVTEQSNAAKLLKLIDEAKEEVMKEKIEGFPHIHMTGKDGKRVDFEVNRTAEELMKFVKENI